MRLKNLTVIGFKSFADRTSLDFEPGITAIVGPNGCGKSNVADAVRWVLGEQSAKALRGGEMADVIFNGTDKRKALGMAEVSLTISDVDEEQLRAAGVPIEYNEVTLTRRVFRDGGSEYFLNKTPSRLRDLQQLFMGTGVGRASYSIMAQGNITQILSSKPEDRRTIFEEAAGITKFKAQKREALRKLDYTEQNLRRVEDLIQEVKRQIGSLQRQAGKARRYQRLRAELQHLETQLARHEHDTLQARISEKKNQSDRLRAAMESRAEQLVQTEEEVRQLRNTSAELDQQINQTQQAGLSLKNQMEQNANRIGFHQERLRELESQNTRALSEIQIAEERHLETRQELEALQAKLQEADCSLATGKSRVEESQDRVKEIENTIRQTQENHQQAQAAAFAAAQTLAKSRNEINAFDFLKKSNDARLEKLSSEKIQLEEERVQLGQTLEQFAAGIAAKRLDADRCRAAVEEHQTRWETLQSEGTELASQLNALLQQQTEKRSRLAVLKQLDANREGFSEGTVAALKRPGKVLGSLADFIRVPDEHLTAVEAALGHHLQIVLTRSENAAADIIHQLRDAGKGQARLVSLQLLAANTSRPPTADAPLPADALPAARLVSASPEAAPVIQSLLDGTLIVSDLARATRLWKQTPGQYDFVTPGGEILTRQGVYASGRKSGGNSTSSSILGRKNEIRKLAETARRLQKTIDAKSHEKDSLADEQKTLQASLQKAQSDLKAAEVAIAADEGEHTVLRNSQSVLNQKIETVIYEIQSLAGQQKESRAKQDQLVEDAARLESQAKTAEHTVQNLAEKLEETQSQRDQANAALTEHKVAFAAEQESFAALKRQISPLEQRLEEQSQFIARRRSETQTVLSKKTQSESEIAESQQQVQSLTRQQNLNDEKTSRLLQEKTGQKTEIDQREADLQNRHTQIEKDRQQKHELEVSLAQDTLKAENICQRIEEKYQIALQDIRSESITITETVEGQTKAETLSPEEMSRAGLAPDWDAAAEQVRALQQKVESIGPVNLVAIEEYEETEQRFQFLTGQHDDLVKAKDELHEVLNRINIQTREMFLQTFNRIRDNFRTMFQELFGGGNADLRMTDEADVLESGIDIVARPPGKRLQNISLLSGGEQTMTAVALLFSIYQVKPSPFCVLDELDAPLDESNIDRFLKVLKRFLEYSQFIIITHNKRTISTADILYGITMQERGISRLVSVKFRQEQNAPPVQPNPPERNTEELAIETVETA